MADSIYFLIEGGKALEVVKSQIKAINDAHKEACALAAELGVTKITTDNLDGKLLGVVFEPPQSRHPDFLKPNRHGVSYPRSKSEWFKRFKAQKGHPITCNLISEELGVPLELRWKNGFSCMGHPFRAAGFLFLGKEPPYAMYIPDVQAEIKEKGQGIPLEPARSFKPEFEGCRRILVEEWELIVAQHAAKKALEKAQKKLDSTPAAKKAVAKKTKKPATV